MVMTKNDSSVGTICEKVFLENKDSYTVSRGTMYNCFVLIIQALTSGRLGLVNMIKIIRAMSTLTKEGDNMLGLYESKELVTDEVSFLDERAELEERCRKQSEDLKRRESIISNYVNEINDLSNKETIHQNEISRLKEQIWELQGTVNIQKNLIEKKDEIAQQVSIHLNEVENKLNALEQYLGIKTKK